MVLSRGWAQPIAFAVGALPLASLGAGAWLDRLGANPVETITHETGEWGLRFLIATLAITPLRRVFGLARLAPYRRTLGLLAFSYASLHFATYLVLDLSFSWNLLLEDLVDRTYITAGFTAFLCMLPLAITSTRGWIRRLGPRWVTLHRLAYVAGIAAVLHFLWLVKADHTEPLVYAALLGVALAARLLPVSSGTRPANRARRASTSSRIT